MPRITFNGKTYNDLAEMPATERQAYEQLMVHFKDEDGDGTPDIFQGDVVSNIVNAVATTDIIVDGKRVGGFQNLTQEQRLKLENGMSMLKKMGIIDEIPNLDGGIHAPHPTAMPVWDDADRSRPKRENRDSSMSSFPQNTVIQEEGANLRVVLIVVGLIMVAGFGALVFFLMQSGL
mgnify:CR=1 FL=1